MSKLDDQTNSPLPALAPRANDSHKGDFGRALLVGGSRGMSGAIALAGRATLRSGAGLVTLAVPQSVQDVVASIEPSYMTFDLDDDNCRIAASAANSVIELAQHATAVALGPGLGRGSALTEFVVRLYSEIEKPMIVDADALFALAEQPEALNAPGGPRVLTPHPGEFERLTGDTPKDSRERIEAAANLARELGEAAGDGVASAAGSRTETIVLLKGHGTVVTDGTRFSINQTGNAGMATGGSGDVLTGIVTGLLCQGMSAFDAARLGAYVHGLAGDLAAEELGQISLIASDLVDYLPFAFLSLTA